MTVYAFAGGSFSFIGVIIFRFFAFVYGYYTYRGSAINAHSSDGLDGAPGSAGPSQASGRGRTSDDNPRRVQRRRRPLNARNQMIGLSIADLDWAAGTDDGRALSGVRSACPHLALCVAAGPPATPLFA